MLFRPLIPAILAAAFACAQTGGLPGTLVYSTYLRDGFSPVAIATDATGNVYLAGNVVLDEATTGVLVEKLNPQGTRQIYLRYLGGSGHDLAGAIAVDNAGSAYVVGTAYSPDFPVTTGARPGSSTDPRRSFLTKFDANGEVVFSTLLGGSTPSGAQAVAVTPQGQILVSGNVQGSGFPTTAGAYSVPDSGGGRPYLMELDSSGTKVIFSATGIGGSALALDPSANIYVAGNTSRLDYPTTAGAYQTTFHSTFYCFGLCQIGFSGVNQYLTKVNPTASSLIYSTAVSNPTTGGGQIVNAGLAVDSSGNAYLTGIAWGDYAYTVAPPQGAPAFPAFLTKLDAAGQNVVFSVPVGGAGVQVSPDGSVYAGGNYNLFNTLSFLADQTRPQPPPAGSTGVLPQCQPDNTAYSSQAYVTRLDSSNGNVLGTVIIEGSNVTATAVALAGTKAWIAGSTSQADVPITAGAIVPPALRPGPMQGAYLGAVDFSQPGPATAPSVACIVDAANGSHVGPVVSNQLISIFGSNLGPAIGVAAPNGPADSLSGVSVTFDGVPGKLLYVSSSQINVAVPKIDIGPGSTIVQIVTGDGKTPARQLPVTALEPSLFADRAKNGAACPGASVQVGASFFLFARDQDGSMNSCSAPAKAGSVVTAFLNGVGGLQPVNISLLQVAVRVGRWSAEVVNVSAENDFVTRIDFRLPAVLMPPALGPYLVEMSVTQNGADIPVGPLSVASVTGINVPAGLPLNTYIWVSP